MIANHQNNTKMRRNYSKLSEMRKKYCASFCKKCDVVNLVVSMVYELFGQDLTIDSLFVDWTLIVLSFFLTVHLF